MKGLYISLTFGIVFLSLLAKFTKVTTGLALTNCAFGCFLLIIVIFLFQTLYEWLVNR